jgi:RNA polymerase sigma factor (sigma-70 family)
MDDWDLLEQFRLTRSEQAFGELVRRHAGFVLGTCRRRLRDAHLSEDAAQAVFLVLARRPPTKSAANASLAGWLYKTALYACNNAMRDKRTRDLHEHRAGDESSTTTTSPSVDASLTRADAERLLDDALAELSRKEREAVLLRYYGDQSVQQVGAALGISSNSATKRIGRAVERMREFLAGKGLAISSPVLVEAIAQAMRTSDVPADFVANAIAIATGKSIASVVVKQLAEGVNHMIRIAQVKLVVAVVAVVSTAGGGIVAVNQLMAQSNASKPAAVVASNEAATPKATLLALAAAARAADVEGIKKLVDTKNPSDQQLLLAACEYSGARKALLEAVNAKFGEPAMTRLGGRMLQINLFDAFLNDLETNTEQRTEKTHGNEAILSSTEGDFRDVRMVRDDSGWKLSATGMTKDWPQEKHTEVLTGVQQGSATLVDLTNQINDGKFATFADLARTVRGMTRGQ